MLDAETPEEATIDDHIQALEIINEKTKVLETADDKDILFISTFKEDTTVIGTTGIFSQETDIIETFYKDTLESKEMDIFSWYQLALDQSPIGKTPVPASLSISNSSTPTSVLPNSLQMQVIVFLPAGFLVLIVLAFLLCAFLLRTRKRKLSREKIDLVSTAIYKDYKQVANI